MPAERQGFCCYGIPKCRHKQEYGRDGRKIYSNSGKNLQAGKQASCCKGPAWAVSPMLIIWPQLVCGNLRTAAGLLRPYGLAGQQACNEEGGGGAAAKESGKPPIRIKPDANEKTKPTNKQTTTTQPPKDRSSPASHRNPRAGRHVS